MSKERLVELIYKGLNEWLHSTNLVMEKHIADKILADGVIVPTLNLGSKVWFIDGSEVCKSVVVKVEYNLYTTPSEWITLRIDSSIIGAYESKRRTDLILGKILFLTREEAEKKLSEMNHT